MLSLFDKSQRNRQYIRDRCFGKSKYDEEFRPPCYVCFVPNCVYCCSDVLEQNCLCERSGTVGCVKKHDEAGIRRRVFRVGLAANLVALVLTSLACFSISTNFDVIRLASFSRGVQRVQNVTLQGRSLPVSFVDIGLRAVAVTNFIPFNNSTDRRFKTSSDQLYIGRRVVTFDHFCDYVNVGLSRYMDPQQCDSCHASSKKFVASVIVSLLLVIPSITTDILRMYPNYDVNCQKFYGSIVSTLSMLFSIYTCIKYNSACFASFYDGDVLYYRNFTVAQPGTPNAFVVHFDWQAGNGLILLYTATALKIVDIVCNAMVPTPSITRDHNEQELYERLYGKSKSNSTTCQDCGERGADPNNNDTVATSDTLSSSGKRELGEDLGGTTDRKQSG